MILNVLLLFKETEVHNRRNSIAQRRDTNYYFNPELLFIEWYCGLTERIYLITKTQSHEKNEFEFFRA